jgi:hypothetical protein
MVVNTDFALVRTVGADPCEYGNELSVSIKGDEILD